MFCLHGVATDLKYVTEVNNKTSLSDDSAHLNILFHEFKKISCSYNEEGREDFNSVVSVITTILKTILRFIENIVFSIGRFFNKIYILFKKHNDTCRTNVKAIEQKARNTGTDYAYNLSEMDFSPALSYKTLSTQTIALNETLNKVIKWVPVSKIRDQLNELRKLPANDPGFDAPVMEYPVTTDRYDKLFIEELNNIGLQVSDISTDNNEKNVVTSCKLTYSSILEKEGLNETASMKDLGYDIFNIARFYNGDFYQLVQKNKLVTEYTDTLQNLKYTAQRYYDTLKNNTTWSFEEANDPRHKLTKLRLLTVNVGVYLTVYSQLLVVANEQITFFTNLTTAAAAIK